MDINILDTDLVLVVVMLVFGSWKCLVFSSFDISSRCFIWRCFLALLVCVCSLDVAVLLKICGVIFPLIDLKKKAVFLFEAFPGIMYYVQSFIVIFFLSLFVRFAIDPDSLEFGSQELRFLNHDFLTGVGEIICVNSLLSYICTRCWFQSFYGPSQVGWRRVVF